VLTMKGYRLTSLSIFLSTCRGSNTTFKWASDSPISATSTTHGGIGDYVAAGLGIDTHKTSSTSVTAGGRNKLSNGISISTEETSSAAISTSGNRTLEDDTSARRPTQPAETTNSTPAANLVAPTGHLESAAEIENTTTATDCWHSWVDYWSASSLNMVTYETSFYNPRTETRTELREEDSLIPTSSWESFVDTATYSSLSTVYSDGFPVSVAVSYETRTYSDVGWAVYTIWSSLSEFHTTFTETYNFYDYVTTTRSTTALPTPRCELPTAASQCNEQWSSYIYADSWKYYDDFDDPNTGYFPGTPDCTQAMITGDWCTSMASFYFARETMYGQGADVGWKTANGTSYFPASKSLAPGCSLGCQACSITGETVQLYYWPPATATLVENGTETATLMPLARNDSSPRTVSIDGKPAVKIRRGDTIALTNFRNNTYVAHDVYLLRRFTCCQFLRRRRKNIQKHHSASTQHQSFIQPRGRHSIPRIRARIFHFIFQYRGSH
jgi:hypothetical protein